MVIFSLSIVWEHWHFGAREKRLLSVGWLAGFARVVAAAGFLVVGSFSS